MNRDDLRTFARRNWEATARSRLQYWADRYRREGGGPARRAATALYEHASRIGSTMLDDEHRADDLAHHLRVSEQLGRAARSFTGR